MSFSAIDEVIELANTTTYGLAAYVFSQDLSVAVQVTEALEFGTIGVNEMSQRLPKPPSGE